MDHRESAETHRVATTQELAAELERVARSTTRYTAGPDQAAAYRRLREGTCGVAATQE